jgi:zeaxanthin glucosyltransferase
VIRATDLHASRNISLRRVSCLCVGCVRAMKPRVPVKFTLVWKQGGRQENIVRIGFASIRVPGHLNPMTALARKVQARGHDVALIAVPDAEPFVQAAGIPFVPFCEKEYPKGSLSSRVTKLSTMQGEEAIKFTMEAVAGTLEAAFRNLPQTIHEAGVDGLVLDTYQVGLGLAPMHLGMPYVHVSNALHFDFSGNTPFCTFDWRHETTPEALERNRKGLQKMRQMFEPSFAVARAYAEEARIRVDWDDPYATISKLAWLTQSPKEFDFKSSHWPEYFHYTGPFHDGRGRIESDFPWDRLTGDPLIYASMGTIMNGLDRVFSTIAEAVGNRTGLQLVLSIGPALDPKQIRSLSQTAIAVHRAPQLELLLRTSLCITHAGMNTAMESLTQGVPMVAIPVTNDQPGVAARIAATNTGRFVPLKELTTPRLKSLIDEVLGNPMYRENAQKMKRVIAETKGLEKAADVLEQAFGVRTPKQHRVSAAKLRLHSIIDRV